MPDAKRYDLVGVLHFLCKMLFIIHGVIYSVIDALLMVVCAIGAKFKSVSLLSWKK